MGKNERYSVLQPLPEQEMYNLVVKMWNFFAITNNRKIRKQMSLPVSGGLRPLSLTNFMSYIQNESDGVDWRRYQAQIAMLASTLESKRILVHAGDDIKGEIGYTKCYYNMKELSNRQEEADFWLGDILGARFLRQRLENHIVRIEGKNKKDIPGTGSGILIAPDVVLTCAHNMQDMQITSCWIGDKKLEIQDKMAHSRYDVGIIKVMPVREVNQFPYFGAPAVLEQTLTLGYPPIRGLRNAVMLAQNGEINAIGSETFRGCETIVISSITRPGNSGGPVFSLQGYIVGIVTEEATTGTYFGKQSTTGVSFGKDDESEKDEESVIEEPKVEAPFYLAISSNALREIIPEIDPSIEVRFEDFQ